MYNSCQGFEKPKNFKKNNFPEVLVDRGDQPRVLKYSFFLGGFFDVFLFFSFSP